jgi:hypothetical protein
LRERFSRSLATFSELLFFAPSKASKYPTRTRGFDQARDEKTADKKMNLKK